jgi:SAM-dependent methyltransferase
MTKDALSNLLSEGDYNRQRLAPEAGDEFYIPLSDLKLFLDRYQAETFKQLLDYGCGGSPYRALFKVDKYIRADYTACEGIDLLIGDDGVLKLSDGCCDAVLSTQVLEHVFSPQKYLGEALRVLTPNGKLILTTHGMWEDHACPYDFWRWTADGLRREVEKAGFKVTNTFKMTTGPRAVLFQFGQFLYQIKNPRRGLLKLALELLKRSAFKIPAQRHQWMDEMFADHRMILSEAKGNSVYLCLGIEAVKVA